MKGPASQYFSASYAEARRKFLDAARDAGLAVESLRHPEKGRDGEELAMDIARDGHPNAGKLLILTSACHGVEGYCGTGVQVAALRDREWLDHAHSKNVAVLYIHALNPYGFSHIRRTTQENVDLNRNFHDYGQPLPANEGYRELQPLLLPEQWPPTPENEAAIAKYIADRGERTYQQAISGGQHDFEDGIFFGGKQPTWSNKTFREVLRNHAQRCGHLAWIDIHTGLGPSGVGERIFAGPDDKAAIARAKAWWGGDGRTPITSFYDGSSTSAKLTGLMFNSVLEECPHAEYTGIALEYGTQPLMDVMQALRADHWLHLHPEASPEVRKQIKQQVMDAFYTDTEEWKQQILAQAREALFQAVDGLAG